MSFTWKHVLYRFYDADGALLYVGITNSISQRFRTHATEKPWWPEVVDCRIAFYPDRAAVARAEEDAIRYEHPRYNIRQGSPMPQMPRKRTLAAPDMALLARIPLRDLDAPSTPGRKVPLRQSMTADEWDWMHGLGEYAVA